MVKHLRQVFDSFLQGTAKLAEAKLLSEYERAYFQSPFVVLSYSRAIMGGSTISMIFQNKPDKIFNAWVYGRGDIVELRMFDGSAEDEVQVAQIRRQYAEILRDRAMAL